MSATRTASANFYGTRAIQAGVPSLAVQKLLDHTTLDMVALYVHYDDVSLREALKGGERHVRASSSDTAVISVMADISAPEAPSARDELQALDKGAGVLPVAADQRRDALKKVYERIEGSGDPELEAEILSEVQLAYATIAPVALLDPTRGRFVDFAPDLKSDAALDYFVSRLGSPSVLVRAVVGDFLWEYGGARRRHLLNLPHDLLELAAARAVEARAGVEFAWLHTTDPVVRAAQVAVGLSNNQAMREVADRSLALLEELRQDNPRHAIDLVIALSAVAAVLTPAEVEEANRKIQSVADDLLDPATSPSSHLGQAALQLRKRFLAATGAGGDALHDVDRKAVDSLISEGDAQLANGNGLVASVWYRQAMDMLRHMPADKNLVAALRKKARDANLAGLDDMKVTTFTEKVPTEVVEKFIRSFTDVDFPEVLEHIALRADLLIWPEMARELEAHGKEIAPLSSIFPHVEVTASGRIIAPTRAEDLERQRLYRAVRYHLMFQNVWIADIVKTLRDEKGVTSEGIVEFLRQSGNFEEGNLALISHGLTRALADDVVSAMHILVPQLEDVLRNLLKAGGVDPLGNSSIPGVSMEATLGAICVRLGEAGLLDEQTLFLFGLILADPLGENLRNEVGHGLIREGDCTWPNLARIIQLYLIVAMVKPPASEV